MAIFEEHKYEKKYLSRLHNPKTANKPITRYMDKQKRTSDPQPNTSYLSGKKKKMIGKMLEDRKTKVVQNSNHTKEV